MVNDYEPISYVLITPARNEEDNIERTIRSVISQTILPKRWIIVSDCSTDRTDYIVGEYTSQNSWIELVRMPEHRARSFAAKAHCFRTGYDKLKNTSFDIIGNVDADVSFEEDYFEFLLAKFQQNQRLGVCGTPFIEEGYSSTNDSYEGQKHVPGGCQLFRRKCFEDVGGYPFVKEGIDWVAVTTARMKGWETRSFRERSFFHYRSLGTGESTSSAAIIRYGKKDYLLGGHPLWEFFRILYQMTRKPYMIAGILVMYGYFSALLNQEERFVSQDLMIFHRHEQMDKLRFILGSKLMLKKVDKFDLTYLIP